jgi:diguanylate cyclase (GGDEF)-like protein
MSTVRRQATGRAQRARSWPIWELPTWLLVFVVGVIAADVVAIAAAAAGAPLRTSDLYLAGVLLACDLATVELTHRVGEPAGASNDVFAVWELPLAILLPPVYVLVLPVARVLMIQLRVRSTLVYRRAFTAAALGLGYGLASVIFRWASHALRLTPAITWPGFATQGRVLAWAGLAAACGALGLAVIKVLVGAAAKGSDPSTSMRRLLFSREQLFHDMAELAVSVVIAFVVTGSPVLALVALPIVTLLHRSSRHAQLVDESRLDGKTGLLNMTAWQREARTQVSRAAGTRMPLAVAIADIDHFKVVNDTFGHLAGDLVLAGVAQALTDSLRGGDVIGRFGGEEFVILLPRTDGTEARQITERLCRSVAQLATPAGDRPGSDPLRVTISIGVAAMESARRDLEDLIAAADHALYAAKQAGRNRVHMLSEAVSARQDPEPDLPAA